MDVEEAGVGGKKTLLDIDALVEGTVMAMRLRSCGTLHLNETGLAAQPGPEPELSGYHRTDSNRAEMHPVLRRPPCP